MAISQFNKLIHKISIIIFNTNFWVFYCVNLLISFFQNGLSNVPVANLLLRMAKDIYSNPFDGEPSIHFLLYSFLGPILAFFTGFNENVFLYASMHFVLIIFIFTGLLIIIRNRYGDFSARVLIILFVLSPISKVVETWLGYPDGFTLVISIGIVLFRTNLLLVGVLAFLQGINHFEQGFLILILIIIFDYISSKKKFPIQFALAGFSGIIFGRIILDLFFWKNNFGIVENRLSFISRTGLFHYLEITLSNPITLLFSLFNLVWIFLIIYAVLYWKSPRVKALLACISLAFVPALLTLDQTRIFSLLSFPVLLLVILDKPFIDLQGIEKELISKGLALSLVAGFFIPRIILWDGVIYSSSYQGVFEWAIRLFNF